MKQIIENVVQLLKENENFRNDDRPLIFEYWRRFDHVKHLLSLARPLTTPATIIRIRQKLQSEGYFLPTDHEVITRRHKQKIKIKVWLEDTTRQSDKENTSNVF